MQGIEKLVLKYHTMYKAENVNAVWNFSDYLSFLLTSGWINESEKMEIICVQKWEQAMDELLYELSTL